MLVPEGPAGSSTALTIGGQPYDQSPWATSEVIDLDDAAPRWAPASSWNIRRTYANTVLLPDRSMVAVGGNSHGSTWPPPERAVELYDPATGSWRLGPKQVETRAYHSTALLLPDGRVLSAGDDFNPSTTGTRAGSSPDDTAEIYSPPYLFDDDGARIADEDRPAISAAPAGVRWNVPFAVDTPDDVDSAVLVAPSAVTHANDMTQRLVPLQTLEEYPGSGLTLQSPPTAGVAPPGWYMLFLLDDGVPSIARWIRLDPAAQDAPTLPRPAGTLAVEGGTLTYTAAAGMANNVRIATAGSDHVLSDVGPIDIEPSAAGACARQAANQVACPAAGVVRASVDAGDLADRVTTTQSLPVTVRGGDGNDRLVTGSGADTLHGDAGHDTLLGRRRRRPARRR